MFRPAALLLALLSASASLIEGRALADANGGTDGNVGEPRLAPPAPGSGWQPVVGSSSAPLWRPVTGGKAASSGASWQVVGSGGSGQSPAGWTSVGSEQPFPRGAEPVPTPSVTATSTPAPTAPPLIMGMSRGITVNRTLYPDVSLTIPNGFKRDPQHFFSAALNGANQVRRTNSGCRGRSSCSDAEFSAELALLQSGPASVELLYNLESIGIGNPPSAQSLGFRLAANLSSNVGLAIGGDSLIYLDRGSDQICTLYGNCAPFKGRSLFAVASAAFPLSSSSPTPPVLTLTAGAGNGYYGYDGSGDDTRWGPIGSVAVALNSQVALGAEYSGYAISAGISVKPFQNFPLTGSLFVTDFLGYTPDYIRKACPNESCSIRYLGRLTVSF